MFRLGHLALLLATGSTALLAQVQMLEEHQAVEDRRVHLEDQARVWPPVRLGGKPITDNARLRTEAMRQWWGEWTPEFQSFLQNTAVAERTRHEAKMPKSSGVELNLAAPATGTWTNIGPTKADVIKNGSTSLAKTDSGRPRTILVDPTNNQIIYLCTAGGGVWKTTNGGAAWTPITETLGTLSCGYLAMDPTDSRILYLGLGDPFDGTGLGVVKSTDGGLTWSAPQTLGASRTIQSILVDPNNRNIVMAATNVGLFRSVDAGATYTQVASINAAWKCWDLAWAGGTNFVLTAETDLANASGNTGGKVLRSTDEGATWVAATGIDALATRISVNSAPSLRSTLFAMVGKVDTGSTGTNDLLGVYKSTDGGATWALVTSPGAGFLGGQSFYNHMIVIDRSNPSIVYLGGQLAMSKSTNGGSTWTTMTDWLAQNGKPYVHADFHCGVQDSTGSLFVGTDGGIFKSTDGGTTFTDSLNIGITTHMIYSVGSSSAAPSAVIGGFQDNGTRVRSGATTTFNQYIGGDGFGSLMHPVNGSTMLGSLYYTRIQKSTNGGSTFAAAVSGITESNNTASAPFITRLAEGPADATGNTVYTFVNAKVYKSTNYAGTWTAMGVSGLPTTSFYIRNVAAAKSNGQVVGLVANGGKVFLTANGGSSWTTPAALTNHGSYTSSVAFDPTDYNTVYVSSVAPDGTKNHLWKSGNFGGSWTAIDGGGFPAGVPVSIVKVDPSDRNIVYAGTHLGLYRSADGGATWARWGNGLPLVNVTDIYVSPDGATVRVATYGRGFWELRGTASAPTITTQPANQTVNAGQTATFSVVASGTAPFAYQWYRGASLLSGATSASYTTAATTTADNGASFYVLVSNSQGSVNSSSASLTVTTVTDTTAPTVSATESGTSGTITFNATATDLVGVTKVEFYVDGALKGTDTTTPYSMTFDSTTLTDGNHTLVAKAYDAAGNVGTSTSVGFTVSNTIIGVERIINGGFEVATTPWTGTTAAIGTWSAQPAFEGTRNAWLGGDGKTRTEAIYQSVVIPSTVTSATLTFYLHIDTAETTTSRAYDKLAVQILSSTGKVLQTLTTYSNLNKATGYALRTFNVSAHKGKTVRINFKSTEDSTLQTSFAIDKVSLITK